MVTSKLMMGRRIKLALLAVGLAAFGAVAALGLAGALGGPAGAQQRWHKSEQLAFAHAKKSGRHVVIDFGAEWCVPCQKIEKILSGQQVFAELTESFVPLRFDITALTERDEALQAKYRALTLPAVIFVDVEGRELGRYAATKPSKDTLLAAMRRIVAAHPPAQVDR